MRRPLWLAAALILTLLLSLPTPAMNKAAANAYWTQGKQSFDGGNYAAAIATWTQPGVAANFQADVGYFMWLGVAYLNLNDFPNAAANAQRALDLKPTDANVLSNVHWVMARVALADRQFDKASAEAEASIAATPQDPLSHLLLGRIHAEAGRYDKAIAATTRSLELKASPDGFAVLGLANLHLGRAWAALQSFEKGLSLDPKNANARLGQILAQMALLDFPAAEASAKRAVADGVPDATTVEASILYYTGRYDEALARIDARLADAERGGVGLKLGLTPQNGIIIQEVIPGGGAQEAGLAANDWITEVDGVKVIKGVFNLQPLMTLEELAEKLRGAPGTKVTLKVWRPGKMTPFERTVTRKPLVQKASAIDYAMRAMIWRAKGEADKALGDAQKAAALDMTPFLTPYALGFALLDKGRADEALKAFDDPAMTPTLLAYAEAHRQVGKALCWVKKGDMGQATKLFFAAVDRLDPRAVPGWRDRGAFLELVKPQAQAHLEAAKKLEAEARYTECLVEYAEALRLTGDEGDVAALRLALFSAAAKITPPPELPEEARRHTVRGELMMKMNELDSARAEFSEAVRIAPHIPRVYYNAALVNAQMGRFAEAIGLMNVYLQAAPQAEDARSARDEIIKWELLAERQKGR